MKYKEHAWVLTLTRYTLWTPTYEALLLSSFQIMSSRPWNITCEQLNSQTNHTESANVLDLVLEENKHFLNKQSIFSCLIHWLFYIICLLHLLLFLHVIWWCYISVQKATRLQGYKKTTHIFFFFKYFAFLVIFMVKKRKKKSQTQKPNITPWWQVRVMRRRDREVQLSCLSLTQFVCTAVSSDNNKQPACWTQMWQRMLLP